ncbi:transposase [Embleya sp. NPDC020886]|uniref:transposase n=1 Tax=Embleya sp. NPDC020886 TaxID=3363980 RepID=UPI0037A60147
MGKKKPRPRRSFTPEFKAEIVALCRQGDRSVGQVAKDFDPTETAVRDRVKQAEVDTGERNGTTSAEREELTRLRRENTRLRQDVEVLKRATAFFASMPKLRTSAGWWCKSGSRRRGWLVFSLPRYGGLSLMCRPAGSAISAVWPDRSVPACPIEACPRGERPPCPRVRAPTGGDL